MLRSNYQCWEHKYTSKLSGGYLGKLLVFEIWNLNPKLYPCNALSSASRSPRHWQQLVAMVEFSRGWFYVILNVTCEQDTEWLHKCNNRQGNQWNVQNMLLTFFKRSSTCAFHCSNTSRIKHEQYNLPARGGVAAFQCHQLLSRDSCQVLSSSSNSRVCTDSNIYSAIPMLRSASAARFRCVLFYLVCRTLNLTRQESNFPKPRDEMINQWLILHAITSPHFVHSC